ARDRGAVFEAPLARAPFRELHGRRQAAAEDRADVADRGELGGDGLVVPAQLPDHEIAAEEEAVELLDAHEIGAARGAVGDPVEVIADEPLAAGGMGEEAFRGPYDPLAARRLDEERERLLAVLEARPADRAR